MKRTVLLLLAAVMPTGVFTDANEDLFEGSLKRNVEKTKTGLSNGGDVFAKNKYSLTPIYYAATHCDVNILPLLLEKAKNPTTEQKKLLSDALVDVATGNQSGPHYCKMPQKDIISVIRLLIRAGADVNHKFNDRSILYHMVFMNQFEVVKFLVANKANVNQQYIYSNGRSSNALLVAEHNRNAEIIALLKKAGAKANGMPTKTASKATESSPTPSTPRICLAFDATGALTCRDMPGSTCPGHRFWAGPGPCSTYSQKTVQQLNKSDWGSLISAFNGEAEKRNEVDEPKRESKLERCQKACRLKKCGSKMSGEYTSSPSAGLRCAGFCDQECSTNPGAYR